VEFSYDAKESYELTLRKGDTITDVQTLSDGWCTGLLRGRRGAFPLSFVKVR
jgi:Variant SH3 domain